LLPLFGNCFWEFRFGWFFEFFVFCKILHLQWLYWYSSLVCL
jgi:hypothetical protein